MVAPVPLGPGLYELQYRRECYTKVRDKFERISDRDETIPARPGAYRVLRGSYTTVSKEAQRLNELQYRAGFLDYLYWPELVATSASNAA